MVVLLEEHHLQHHVDMLQMVDSLLAMGEVPGLFTLEEQDKLLLAMKEKDAKAGVGDRSPQALATAFVETVKQVGATALGLHCCTSHASVDCCVWSICSHGVDSMATRSCMPHSMHRSERTTNNFNVLFLTVLSAPYVHSNRS